MDMMTFKVPVLAHSIRRQRNSSWIPTCVGMTCSGITAHFAILFENGYITFENAPEKAEARSTAQR